MKIFRGNTLAVRRQIAEELAALDASKLDAADQFSGVAVTGAVSPTLASIKHDQTFYNTTGGTLTVTLPNSGLSAHVGKRFHFVASGTYASPLTVTSATTGLLRNKTNTGGPFTVTNGTLTITISGGALSGFFYSVGGEFA